MVVDVSKCKADEGCTDDVIQAFDGFIKPRGQEFLEEIDVWFSSRKNENDPGENPKETGIYMVHYVEDKEDQKTLRMLLADRGADSEY